MSVFYGLATQAMSPDDLAPTSEKQNNWSHGTCTTKAAAAGPAG
jgi:hypothetical protein